MACPLCGEHCTCSYAQTTRVSAPHSLTYEYDNGEGAPYGGSTIGTMNTHAFEEEHPPAPPEDVAVEPHRIGDPEPDTLWKQEVADRLENYRARRGTRRPRYNGTLSLDFDRAANRILTAAVSEQTDSDESPNEFFGAHVAPQPQEQPAEPDAAEYDAANRLEPVPVPVEEQPQETNIIEFPRLPTLFDPTPSGSELADPVLDKPRILYVPEEVPTAQAPLADIQLPPAEPPAGEDIELPLRVAPMGQRVLAGIADTLLVLVASFLFMAIVLREVPAPDSRLGYMLVAVLPAVLWAIYEYFFLVHCATTPGMQMTKLTLASFNRQPVGRQIRRGRALACMLSTFPLGLGIIWALVDDDALCWHDRITRTYLVDLQGERTWE